MFFLFLDFKEHFPDDNCFENFDIFKISNICWKSLLNWGFTKKRLLIKFITSLKVRFFSFEVTFNNTSKRNWKFYRLKKTVY